MARFASFLVFVSVLFTGCVRTPPPVKVDPPKPGPASEILAQGLTKAEQARFHHLAMGSEIVPLSWLRALEREDGALFLDSIERFGLIADPNSDDGLPIGLTAAPSKDARFTGKMVGFNCAACHTGELTYRGKSVRIDGGSSLFDAEAFTKDLIGSLAGTFKSPPKLLAFIKRQLQDKEHSEQLAKDRPLAHRILTGNSAAKLEESLLGRITQLHEAEQKSLKSKAMEIGMALREDAETARKKLQTLVGQIETGDVKELLDLPLGGVKTIEDREEALRETLTHVVESMRLMKARLDFAAKVAALGKLKLKNTSGGPGRVDDFGAARNLLFDVKYARATDAPCSIPPLWGTSSLRWSDYDASTQSTLERSFATALAGGAVFDPASYQSTVPLRNLGDLELLAAKITAPVWPEDVFGKIDRSKAERGAVHFKQHCAKCHVDAKRPADLAKDKDWPPEMLFDLKDVGTDPQRVLNYAVPLDARSFAEAVQEETGKYVAKAATDDKVSDKDLEKYRAGHNNVWRVTNKYAARPLAAIWATPPYLHNGSVPTMYDLLLPAAMRPATFPLGLREYDPAKLGYIGVMKGDSIFTFDTTLTGNRNIGHEYGTTLTDAERYELIEFLKTI